MTDQPAVRRGRHEGHAESEAEPAKLQPDPEGEAAIEAEKRAQARLWPLSQGK